MSIETYKDYIAHGGGVWFPVTCAAPSTAVTGTLETDTETITLVSYLVEALYRP